MAFFRSFYVLRLRPSEAVIRPLVGKLDPVWLLCSSSYGGESVESLESQVSELEDEVERLSASLETQKLATSEVQTLGNKKVEEISREVTKKVNESWL